jgi:hypothetical protein
MGRTLRIFLAGSVVCLFWAGANLGDEQLSRTQLARLGKSATVLVELGGRPGQRMGQGYGSAFCIHGSGLFVTNEHVVHPRNQVYGNQEGAEGDITLVVHPGEKNEKSYGAKVVRADKQLDLALLRVDGKHDFPTLRLGDAEGLEELMDVVAFGFPYGPGLIGAGGANLGQAPEAGRREYPSVSVNAGSITALRRQGGNIDRIQLDATINPGNSGGPLLNKEGRVIGVVVSMAVAQHLGRTGISYAIPASQLSRFLARPDILFTPPVVKRSNHDQPVEFHAKTTFLVPTEIAAEVELLLARAGEPQRHYPMKLVNGVYEARAIPFPDRKGPVVFRVEVKYADGSVNGVSEERDFKLNQQPMKLSQVEQINLGPEVKVKLASGGTLKGALTDLDRIWVNVGKQPLRLNLSNASEIKVEPPESEAPVSCIIVVRQAGKELARLDEPLYPEGSLQASMDTLRDEKFIKPPRSTSPISYLRVISTAGDYIGQGKTYSYSGEALGVRRNDRGVNVAVGGPFGWQLSFGAPHGQFLEVGEYLDAKRYPFSEASPGIEFSGQGRGCNRISGKFVVWEFEMKGNEVTKLAIDFIQRCEETMPPLYGRLRFQSSFH